MAHSRRLKKMMSCSNPRKIMACDEIDEMGKIYLLSRIVSNPVKEAYRQTASALLIELLKGAGSTLVAIILHYRQVCPDIPFPSLADLTAQMDVLFPDIPDER